MTQPVLQSIFRNWFHRCHQESNCLEPLCRLSGKSKGSVPEWNVAASLRSWQSFAWQITSYWAAPIWPSIFGFNAGRVSSKARCNRQRCWRPLESYIWYVDMAMVFLFSWMWFSHMRWPVRLVWWRSFAAHVPEISVMLMNQGEQFDTSNACACWDLCILSEFVCRLIQFWCSRHVRTHRLDLPSPPLMIYAYILYYIYMWFTLRVCDISYMTYFSCSAGLLAMAQVVPNSSQKDSSFVWQIAEGTGCWRTQNLWIHSFVRRCCWCLVLEAMFHQSCGACTGNIRQTLPSVCLCLVAYIVFAGHTIDCWPRLKLTQKQRDPRPLAAKTWRNSSWFVDPTWRGCLVVLGFMYKQWKFDQVEEFTTLHLIHLKVLEQWSRNNRIVLFLRPLFKDIRKAHTFRSLHPPVYSRLWLSTQI